MRYRCGKATQVFTLFLHKVVSSKTKMCQTEHISATPPCIHDTGASPLCRLLQRGGAFLCVGVACRYRCATSKNAGSCPVLQHIWPIASVISPPPIIILAQYSIDKPHLFLLYTIHHQIVLLYNNHMKMVSVSIGCWYCMHQLYQLTNSRDNGTSCYVCYSWRERVNNHMPLYCHDVLKQIADDIEPSHYDTYFDFFKCFFAVCLSVQCHSTSAKYELRIIAIL